MDFFFHINQFENFIFSISNFGVLNVNDLKMGFFQNLTLPWSFSWHMKFFLTLWTLFSSFLLHYLSVRLEFFTSLLSLDLQRNFLLGLTVKTLNLPTNLAKYSSKRLKIALFFFWARAPGPGLFNLKFCVDYPQKISAL